MHCKQHRGRSGGQHATRIPDSRCHMQRRIQSTCPRKHAPHDDLRVRMHSEPRSQCMLPLACRAGLQAALGAVHGTCCMWQPTRPALDAGSGGGRLGHARASAQDQSSRTLHGARTYSEPAPCAACSTRSSPCAAGSVRHVDPGADLCCMRCVGWTQGCRHYTVGTDLVWPAELDTPVLKESHAQKDLVFHLALWSSDRASSPPPQTNTIKRWAEQGERKTAHQRKRWIIAYKAQATNSITPTTHTVTKTGHLAFQFWYTKLIENVFLKILHSIITVMKLQAAWESDPYVIKIRTFYKVQFPWEWILQALCSRFKAPVGKAPQIYH